MLILAIIPGLQNISILRNILYQMHFIGKWHKKEAIMSANKKS